MKKTYRQPVTETVSTEPQQLLAGSGVEGKLGDTLEIGFGGVDEDGLIDPSANSFGGWDDDSWDKL